MFCSSYKGWGENIDSFVVEPNEMKLILESKNSKA